jgi:hypothetical protein
VYYACPYRSVHPNRDIRSAVYHGATRQSVTRSTRITDCAPVAQSIDRPSKRFCGIAQVIEDLGNPLSPQWNTHFRSSLTRTISAHFSPALSLPLIPPTQDRTGTPTHWRKCGFPYWVCASGGKTTSADVYYGIGTRPPGKRASYIVNDSSVVPTEGTPYGAARDQISIAQSEHRGSGVIRAEARKTGDMPTSWFIVI